MKYAHLIILCCIGIAVILAGLALADGWRVVKAMLSVLSLCGGMALIVIAIIRIDKLREKRRRNGQRNGG